MLRGIRTVFVMSLLTFLLLGYSAVTMTVDRSSRGPVAPWAITIVCGGVASVTASLLLRRRELDGRSPEALRQSFNNDFFVRLQAPVFLGLFAFVLALFTARAWFYWLALPFTILGFVLGAPSAQDLKRREGELRDRGSSLSVLDVLSKPPVKP
jgi:hypothetical protein